MKHTFFTLLVISVIAGLTSCKKNSNMPGIKEYDKQQILNYIAANGITGMVRDTIGGDTSGIYYHILEQDTTGKKALDYTDTISYTYTLRTFDGLYNNTDTVTDHYFGYLGHIAPPGLQLALHNAARYRGTKIRILVPSHLGYGLAGVGSGSKTVTNGRIAGNQCLDYTVYLVPDQAAYDDLAITKYMTANNLTRYTQIQTGEAKGMWYKITVPPTGPNVINVNSSVTLYYTGQLLDNSYFDDNFAPTPIAPHTTTSTTIFSDLNAMSAIGFKYGLLQLGHGGGSISLIMPSRLGYGTTTQTGIPANSCLRFDIQVTGVTNAN
jgi:FKBP-type peptidyl-prolyl cis-trans isomerase